MCDVDTVKCNAVDVKLRCYQTEEIKQTIYFTTFCFNEVYAD